MSLDIWLSIEVDTGGAEPLTVSLYEGNVTHNLGRMAEEAGIYGVMWRPEEHDITTARQLIEPLEAGLKKLKAAPFIYRPLEPPNKWGTYDSFVGCVERYLEACRQHPKATVRVSR